MQFASSGSEPELQPIPNGLSGYESAVGRAYFPMKLCMAEVGDQFESKALSHQLGPILMTRIYATGRYSGQIRTERGDETGPRFALNLSEIGGVFFEGRRNAKTEPGDLMLVNTSQPFDVSQHDIAQSLGVLVPTPLLTRKWGNIDELCLIPISSRDGPAAILRELVLGYWRQRARIDPSAGPELASAIIDLIGATFVRSKQTPLRSLSVQAHFLRVRDLVAANLASEKLSADFISDALGLSKSYLHFIMKSANTTLGRFILDERLARARELLEFPTARKRSISEIAFSVGFQELSHFSKRFSDRFGRSPKTYRAEFCRDGHPHG